MYLLRRAAVRAVSQQPTRHLSTLRPTTTRVTNVASTKPALYRPFHQTRTWLAEEEQKKPASEVEASPAEAETSGETVTTEPSPAEKKEGSVEPTEAQQSSNAPRDPFTEPPHSTSQSTGPRDSGRPRSTSQRAQQLASSAASSASSAVSGAARTARDAFDSAAGSVNRAMGGEAPKPSRILYVGNLFFEVTTANLEAEFSRFGEITNSRVVIDNRGLSKGFGYVEFASQDSADRAVQELDQKVFQGRRMAVQYHVRREPRSGYGQGSRAPISASAEPTKTLFIGNMSYQMSDRDLNDLFKEIRNVLDVRVAIDRRSGQPRGFAHADFIDVSSAIRAKEHLEKKTVYGRQLRVDYSVSSSARQNAIE